VADRGRSGGTAREAILAAARRLFVDEGYGRTSIRRLAQVAGVAPRSVYLNFGSKHGVLAGLLEGLGLDADEPALRTKGEAETDPRVLLDLVARLYRNLYEHGNELIVLFQEGSATEPAIRAVREAGLGRSRRSVGEVCHRLHDLGALRPGLDVDTAAGHALVLLSHGGYDELVVRRGWALDRYQTWLGDALADALLDPEVDGGGR
jgi:AcrR family transcriptional regulator